VFEKGLKKMNSTFYLIFSNIIDVEENNVLGRQDLVPIDRGN
jgi:hypothetical protein